MKNLWRATCTIAMACAVAAAWLAPTWKTAGSLAATAVILVVGVAFIGIAETL